MREIRRQQAIPADRVCACDLDDPLHELRQGAGLVGGLGQYAAQRQGVGAGRDESGPVGGVLHGVGEDQGLLLPRGDGPFGEQG